MVNHRGFENMRWKFYLCLASLDRKRYAKIAVFCFYELVIFEDDIFLLSNLALLPGTGGYLGLCPLCTISYYLEEHTHKKRFPCMESY